MGQQDRYITPKQPQQPQQPTKEQMQSFLVGQLKGMEVKKQIVQALVDKLGDVLQQAHTVSTSSRPQSQAEMWTYVNDAIPVLLRTAVVLMEVNLSSLTMQLDNVTNEIPMVQKKLDELGQQVFSPTILGGR